MPEPLAGKRIVLGVTGGIAAYKAADLTSKLVQLGADVHVVLTAGALEFVQPLTYQALTRNMVYTSVFDGWTGDDAGHVTLATNADAVIVAPATANAMARMAHGLVDDMLSAVLLSTQAPIVLAPAMEHHMWHHPATQANLGTLQERGVRMVSPENGRLASGASGDGRLANIERILYAVRCAIGAGGPLSGRKIVITAGGTHEAVDPVRFIGNSSSGTMGIALSLAAADWGADVTLIAGPSVSSLPDGLNLIRVTSALQMRDAVEDAVKDADILVMAAAVADFRPETATDDKVKRQDGQDVWNIRLVKNPDILADVHHDGLIKIGFAAETSDLVRNAQDKLERKGLAMIIANDAAATIGADDSTATVITRGALKPENLPRMSKVALASEIMRRTVDVLTTQGRL
jgi:phosphopantothenoylcysteine decarboxylase / phosphopantothenate---cysteine ligase